MEKPVTIFYLNKSMFKMPFNFKIMQSNGIWSKINPDPAFTTCRDQNYKFHLTASGKVTGRRVKSKSYTSETF